MEYLFHFRGDSFNISSWVVTWLTHSLHCLVPLECEQESVFSHLLVHSLRRNALH